MKYEVIDNFLDEEYFNSLVTLFTDKDKKGNFNMPWFFQDDYGISMTEELPYDQEKYPYPFFMIHHFYNNHVPKNHFFNNIIPLLDSLGRHNGVNPPRVGSGYGTTDGVCLIRAKGNLYPNTKILHEHPMHGDLPFPHSAAILSLNTCDGYTKLKDGTKIDSVANRILLFDASNEHCSTTTTNVSARINININYIIEGGIRKNKEQ